MNDTVGYITEERPSGHEVNNPLAPIRGECDHSRLFSITTSGYNQSSFIMSEPGGFGSLCNLAPLADLGWAGRLGRLFMIAPGSLARNHSAGTREQKRIFGLEGIREHP